MREFTKIQNDIIKVAIHVLANEGAYKLTTRHISSELGITEIDLSKHFKSKRDILFATIDKCEEFLTFPEYDNDKSIDKIKAFVINRCNNFQKYPEISSIISSESIFLNDKELRNRLDDVISFSRNHILDIVIEGQKQCELKKSISPESIYGIVRSSVKLLVTQWRLKKYTFDLQQEALRACKEMVPLIDNRS